MGEAPVEMENSKTGLICARAIQKDVPIYTVLLEPLGKRYALVQAVGTKIRSVYDKNAFIMSL